MQIIHTPTKCLVLNVHLPFMLLCKWQGDFWPYQVTFQTLAIFETNHDNFRKKILCVPYDARIAYISSEIIKIFIQKIITV